MVKKLLHTRYRVSDLEKTVAFYRDVLGLSLIEDTPGWKQSTREPAA